MDENVQLVPAARGLEVSFARDLETVRTTATRLATLVDSVQAGVLVEDEACQVILVNRSFCEMFGIPNGPDTLVGWETRTVLGWTSELFVERDAFFPRIETLVTERQRVLSEELALVDGRTLERDYIPVFDAGEYQGHFWVFRDITCHKRTEEELRRTAERYRDFVENGVALAWSHDLEGRLTSANRALLWAVGAEREEDVLGLNFVHRIEARYRHLYGEYVEELQRTGAARGFVTVHGVDGVRRVLAYNNVLREDDSGEPVVQGFGENVTDLFQAHHDLKSANLELESANRALAAANRTLERTNRRMDLLNELGDLMQTAESREEAVAILESTLPRIFHTFSGAVYLAGAEPPSLDEATSWGSLASPRPSLRLNECWALRRGRAHPADVETRGPLCPHAGDSGASESLCIPLMAQGRVLGLLHLGQRDGSSQGPDADDVAAVRNLAFNTAEQLALGLVNLELRESLREQALRDDLTGLYNRRYLEERLEQELRRARRTGAPLALLLLDLDRFKEVNDVHGHAAGDVLLARFARLLQETVRADDVVARYGGEEFTVVLPGAGPREALKVAEKLRRRTQRLAIEAGERRLNQVTVSIGAAWRPDCGESPRDLLEAADVALYRAKGTGRNRVVAADPGDWAPAAAGDCASG